MSTITIEKMRKVQEFIPWDKWNNRLNTNCIAYALGLPIDDPKKETFGTIISGGSPIEKLEKLFDDLSLCHRRITSESEIKENEYGIVLYHYFYKEERNFFGCTWYQDEEETHLVRIEQDGTWTHKFGWDYDTSVTNPQEIHDVILEEDMVDVSPTAFFAVRKPR